MNLYKLLCTDSKVISSPNSIFTAIKHIALPFLSL
jgi:hypothetical protein